MKQGFSLLESVVIIALSVLLLMLLSSVMIISLKALGRGDQKAEATQNGFIVFDAISRELRQAKKIETTLPASEIEFEDGHSTSPISYIYYHLNGTDLVRESRRYYFSDDPSTYVHKKDLDSFGNASLLQTVATSTKAEYFKAVTFTQTGHDITIDATIGQNQTIQLQTKVSGRNL